MIDARARWLAAWLLWGVGLAGGFGCTSRPVTINGECTASAAVSCTTGPASADGGADAGNSAGLVGYACSGNARPDITGSYVQGIPQGTICANRGALGDGTQAYCCESAPAPCIYDPAAVCDPSTSYTYQCRGSYRPESYNPLISCGQGVRQGDLINYCCTGMPVPSPCTGPTADLHCDSRLKGWSCASGILPKSEYLGSNQSRPDVYYMLCAEPFPTDNPNREVYCCFPPAVVPVGGTCIPDNQVPGCTSGRFGFACYGRDRPDQDYPPMTCPDPGFAGVSGQGYPATLFCCDLVPQQ